MLNCCKSLTLLSLQVGETPLMKASEKGYTQLVEKLLSRGANVNYKDIVSYCKNTVYHSITYVTLIGKANSWHIIN